MRLIENSIHKGIDFILERRDSESLWRDFLSRTHGQSIDWVTSFIGLNLLSAGVTKQELEKTAQKILKKEKMEGGFGYNEKTISDSDSTAFTIRFLEKFGYHLNLSKYFLKSHQNSDGGFGTYKEKNMRESFKRIPSETSVEGWCCSSSDVTASVLLTIPKNFKALNYLIKSQKRDGRFQSYWWNSDVYATTHCIEVLKNNGLEKEVSKAQQWLTKGENIPEIPFYIALSIQGLIGEKKYNSVVQKRVEQLLQIQNKDGSWDTNPILRFPHPSNMDPWKNALRWREDSKDQNKIFTTSICVRALSQYL